MARPRKPEGQRVRDIAPTGVRLAPELRAALLREAAINGNTITGEIESRLRASFPPAPGHCAEPAPAYSAPTLTEGQRLLLSLFNAMSPEKQLALLTVLRR